METSRTKLRRFTTDDLSNMRLLESDPDIMKFTPAKVPLTIEESKAKLERAVGRQNEFHPYGPWAVEHKETDDFIGWFMLLKTDLEYPELGFMLVKKYWNQGYATEVSKAIIDYGFNTLKVPGISARTNVDNIASIRVLQKLGFTYLETKPNSEGIFFKIYSLLLP